MSPPQSGTRDQGLLSIAAPLATVIGIILLCALVLRRTFAGRGGLASAIGAGGKSPAGILEVLGRYPIARGQSLLLLRMDRHLLLLSHTHGMRNSGAAMTTLAHLTDPEDVASILLKVQEAEDKSAARQFAEMMSRARDGEGLPAEPQAGRQRHAAPDGDAIETWDGLEGNRAGAARAATAADPVRALRDRIAAMKSGDSAAQEAAA